MNEKELRLQQLLEKRELTDDEVNEAWHITEELKLGEEEETELNFEKVRDMSITLQNLRTKRKALEIQAEIRKERKKILELEKHLDKKMMWCAECGKYVLEEEDD